MLTALEINPEPGLIEGCGLSGQIEDSLSLQVTQKEQYGDGYPLPRIHRQVQNLVEVPIVEQLGRK